MRRTLTTVLLALAALATACGHSKPTIQITATPQSLVYSPKVCSKIVVTGTVDGNQFMEGMDPLPSVDTTSGATLIDPAANTDQGEAHIDGQVVGSSVNLNLCPTGPGDVTVTASVSNSYGDTVTASTIVHFTAPQAAVLSFSCKAKNIDALYNSATELAVGCDAAVQDATGKQLLNADIQFMAEAGSVVPSSDTTGSGVPTYVYYPHQGKHGAPAPVAPFSGEPKWTDTDGTIHCPRRGLVTLVAYTPGPVMDTGDKYSGEPYVDANDNGQYDPGEDFFDANKDGSYSPSQAGAANQYVWKQVKILWTGTLSSNPTVAKVQVAGGGSYDLAQGQSKTISFQLVDDNFNVLAANNPAGDNITWQLSPDGQVGLGGGQSMSTTMVNSFGINIDPVTYELKNPMQATSYLQGATYTLKITDMRMPMDMMGSLSYTVYGMTNRTGVVDDMGNFGDNVSEMTASVGGALGD